MGGSAGTQSSGYAVGQGGAGANNVGSASGPGCTGGGGGGSSGANGSICLNTYNWPGPGGGGGGSGFVSTSTALVSTSTSVGVNSGNGSITIVGLIAPVLTLGSLNQYYADGTTTLRAGDSTADGKVVLSATLNSEATSSVQLQVEVERAGAGFANVANVTSSALITPGGFATTSFSGFATTTAAAPDRKSVV